MENRSDGELPHVVVLGGGFAGLTAVRALARAPVRVTLLDRRNHHLFQPLLYQVATAALNPSDIATPLRAILRRQRNVMVMLGEANAIDPAARRVHLDNGDLGYDFLIVAAGATHSYFGHDEWERDAPGLKTIEDALEIRRRVLSAFEAAELEPDPERRRAWLTFAIVGAGPTGAELAGAVAEVAYHSLARDFRVIDPRTTRILLVEGLDRVLPTYSSQLSASAERQLRSLGVDVRTGTRVTSVDARGLCLGDERIEAGTILWAAGVAASPLARSLGAPLDRSGRVRVRPDLTIEGHPELFVVGDLAALEQDGAPVPAIAPAAMQEGRYVAQTIRRTLRGQPIAPFRYRHKGSFATIGRGRAVGQLRRSLELTGFLAWLAWLLIHIFFLIGFRNRLLVLFGWAYSYFTYRRGARLITGEHPGREPHLPVHWQGAFPLPPLDERRARRRPRA